MPPSISLHSSIEHRCTSIALFHPALPLLIALLFQLLIALPSIVQVAELASLAQLLSPRSPTVRNPAPDSSLCRAAPRLRPLQLSAARRLRRFSCCSQARLRHTLQLLLPVCFRFQLLLPGLIAAYASTALPVCFRFQLLLPDCAHFSCCSRSRPLRLLLPDCVRFNCCSPTALAGFQPMPSPGPMFSNILRGVRGSVNKLKYEGRASL